MSRVYGYIGTLVHYEQTVMELMSRPSATAAAQAIILGSFVASATFFGTSNLDGFVDVGGHIN